MSILGRYNSYNINNSDTYNKQLSKVVEIKLVMIGDSSVGKTSIVTRLALDKFNPDNTSTIGASFNVLTRKTSNNDVIKFQIWDTAGQDRFRSLVPMYVQRCNLAFFVFDITSISSFISIKNYWYKFVTSIEPFTEIILIGNKSDLDHKRQVSKSEAEIYAENMNIPYIECSAMNINNISKLESLMLTSAQKIRNLKVDHDIINNKIDISEEMPEKLSCTGSKCLI